MLPRSKPDLGPMSSVSWPWRFHLRHTTSPFQIDESQTVGACQNSRRNKRLLEWRKLELNPPSPTVSSRAPLTYFHLKFRAMASSRWVYSGQPIKLKKLAICGEKLVSSLGTMSPRGGHGDGQIQFESIPLSLDHLSSILLWPFEI